MKKFGPVIAGVIVIAVIAVIGLLYFADYLEREKPSIRTDQPLVSVGKQKNIGIEFTDHRSGLSKIRVEITQDDQARLIAEETLYKRGTDRKLLPVTIDSTALKLKNGPAVITLSAEDHALIKNRSVVTIPVQIDTIPPQIYLLNPLNYVNQGGTGFVVYRTSKPAPVNGVYVNDVFTPGYNILLQGKPVSVVFFAMPLDAANGRTRLALYARDDAGNEARSQLPFHIREKKFRSDRVNLGEAFLNQKMPDFQSRVPELQDKPLEDVFAYINSTLREKNDQTIAAICSTSAKRQLWDGAFLRMSNAASTALFGDKRTYYIDGKPYGSSVHLGIDLASVAQAPIEAANAGRIAFTGDLGIYGNTVIIDHGLGLFSLYSHLSAIDTEKGKDVLKGEKIGRSGFTGLAGGDHLHFSILAGGQFVNPQEWWDPNWIADNVINKMSF